MAETLFDDAELGEPVPAWKQLRKLAPPPLEPVATATPEQWQELEHSLGLALPQDYKQFVNTYGNGRFADFLGVYDPFYQYKHPQTEASYLIWISRRLTGLKKEWRTYPEYIAPFLPYPAHEGLLPWGFTDNGDTLCWQTIGNADNWPLILVDNKVSERYDMFSLTMTDFLVRWLSQQIEPKIFPNDIFPAEKLLFRPIDND